MSDTFVAQLMLTGAVYHLLAPMSTDWHNAGRKNARSQPPALKALQMVSVRADTLLAIHEGEQHGDVWFAKSIEVRINADKSVTYLSTCKVDFPLPEGNKKGWEGAEYVDKGAEGEFLLGLCEGNHCQV